MAIKITITSSLNGYGRDKYDAKLFPTKKS